MLLQYNKKNQDFSFVKEEFRKIIVLKTFKPEDLKEEFIVSLDWQECAYNEENIKYDLVYQTPNQFLKVSTNSRKTQWASCLFSDFLIGLKRVLQDPGTEYRTFRFDCRTKTMFSAYLTEKGWIIDEKKQTITVPKREVGKAIGKRGSTIKQLNKLFNVNFKVIGF